MTEESSDSATNHVEMELPVDKLQVEDPSQELENDKETNNHTAVASPGNNSNDHVVTDSGDPGDDAGAEGGKGEEEEIASKEDDGEDVAGGSSGKKTEAGGDASSKSSPPPEKVDKKKARRKSTEHSEDDESVDNEMEEGTRRRRDVGRRSRREIDSSDTESDVEREDEADKKSEPELTSDFEDDLLSKPLPKPKWHAISQLRARERGMPKNRQDFCNEAIGSVHLVSRFEKYCELKKHDGCVNTLHFNQSGNLLASGSDDLEVVLWDWARQKPVLTFESGHRSNVFQAKFMPFSGDTTLVSCARDGQVRVAELSSTGICKGTKKIVQHKQAAHKLGLEPNSPVEFLSCGEDAAVFDIDLRNTTRPNKLLTVKENDKKVALYTIYVNPANTNEFAVGGRDHFVRVYDKRRISEDDPNGVVKKYCPHHLVDSDIRANVTCCVYSHDGSEILASYNDEDIYIFDSSHSDGADAIHKYKGHRNNATVKGVNFYGPRSEFIVSGSDCGHIFLWEKESERIVQYMKGDVGGVINCLESHPSSAVLATSGLDHDVKVWMPTATETSKLEGLKRVSLGVINCLESHPSSAVLATSGLDHDVKVWMPTATETSKLEGLKRVSLGVINCLESHPSSAVLATSGLVHDVKVWMPTATETSTLEGLKRTMFSNRREREEERRSEPDFIDNHMLMFLMHHLRRRAIRQARDAGEIDAEDISPSDSDDDDDDDEDDDDGDLPRENVQCAPS